MQLLNRCQYCTRMLELFVGQIAPKQKRKTICLSNMDLTLKDVTIIGGFTFNLFIAHIHNCSEGNTGVVQLTVEHLHPIAGGI
jgi:hypothetical protein